ncbi:MAG: DedA family protein [Moritella sp.]|uniref:YqaA family protein n=1 Tax=Moritella sp. TaxID=78556 RepID=UPI0025FDC482|nr:YqaA family protein [Moritella sp.]NQZ93043.1 DedA family protein [Moritella sp.]
MGLWLLFFSSFTSATILPGSSEILLTAMLVEGSWSYWQLFVMATSGNVLGSILTFYMGYFIHAKKPIDFSANKHYQRVHDVIQRWGWSSLLFSWLPIVGDVFCLLAGWLRVNPLLAFIAIMFGKSIRYAILIWFMSAVS